MDSNDFHGLQIMIYNDVQFPTKGGPLENLKFVVDFLDFHGLKIMVLSIFADSPKGGPLENLIFFSKSRARELRGLWALLPMDPSAQGH